MFSPGKKCFLRFLDLFVFGLSLTCLTYALDFTTTIHFFLDPGNVITRVFGTWTEKITHKIEEKTDGSIGRFLKNAKAQKQGSGKLMNIWTVVISNRLWKRRPEKRVSAQHCWQTRN